MSSRPPFSCPRAIFDDPRMSLAEKVERIRILQKSLHLLPPESSDLTELIALCHEVSNKLTGQLIKASFKTERG